MTKIFPADHLAGTNEQKQQN